MSFVKLHYGETGDPFYVRADTIVFVKDSDLGHAVIFLHGDADDEGIECDEDVGTVLGILDAHKEIA